MTRHHSATGTAAGTAAGTAGGTAARTRTGKGAALLEPAEHVPGYRDLAPIGHGGFSVVYRAVQESVDRAVAVKVLTVAGPDEDARRRFVREVRLAGRLSGHPHVVTVLDTGSTASGRPFLAMDLYEGGSMKEWLGRRGPLSPAQTAGLGAKIADALAAAHELGVLHRDVKPNNILVSRYGEPALADFGVSCLLDSSISGSVLDIFSPQHAAPELMTRGVPSVASDVYALGSTLYELLTGRPPFGGNGQDVRATMFRTVSEPAPRAESPGLPELADAIERAMAKEPRERFADAAEFARELRGLIPDGAAAALAMADVSGLCWEDQADLGGHPAVVAPQRGGSAVRGPVVGGSVVGGSAVRGSLVGGSLAAGSLVGGAADAAADDDASADMTDEMYVYSSSAGLAPRADDTMVRPDRVDEAERGGARGGVGARAGRSGRGGRAGRGGGTGRGGGVGTAGGGGNSGKVGDLGRVADEPRSRKPLAVVAGVALVAGAAWAVIASQGSGAPHEAAAANPAPPSTSDTASSPAVPQGTPSASPTTHSTSSSSASPTHHASSTTPSHAALTSSAATSAAGAPQAPPSTVSTSSSSSGPPLPGIFHRFRNAGNGSCLVQPAGGDTAGTAGCASDRAQGWQYSVPLTGILGAVTGQFELVNGGTGQCLTGGGGSVTVRPCTGSAGQIWAKTGGAGGTTEFQNAADGQCLKTVPGAVTEGACSGDAVQWSDDGTV